jgi:hypothetical protein
MTIEETKERIAVMQAYVDGKQIQGMCSDGKWVDVPEPSWSINGNFRVKPEPKFRPFKNADECWQEMLKHEPFGWVVIIENNLSIKYNIQALIQDGVKSTAVLTDDVMSEKFPFEGVLQKFTFVDGTPFGIKKEEV